MILPVSSLFPSAFGLGPRASILVWDGLIRRGMRLKGHVRK
jgi:hypothetical protein